MTSSKGVGLAASKVVPRFKGPVLAVGSKRQKLGSGCALPARMGLQSEGANGLRCIHQSDHLRVRSTQQQTLFRARAHR